MIRLATPDDFGAITQLDHVAFADPARRRSLEARAAEGSCAIYERDERVHGVAVLRRAHFFDRDFVELLVVDATHRRRGVGRALLGHVVDVSTTDRVFTSTNESNKPMRALLAAEGWLPSGTLHGLDDDPELVFFHQRTPLHQGGPAHG